jgi:hypothetical protein
MAFGCKGLCTRYKATKPKSGSRYGAGQKGCSSCNVFLNWQGLFCPCCGIRLRLKPKTKKQKEKLQKELKITLLTLN